MDYKKFCALIKADERDTVDFKIQCDAFLSTAKGKVAKAELAKDICAMANNGNVASYLIVGVSDDGKNCVSVTNSKLTSDNLQSFCKTAVHPPPTVILHRQVFAAAWDHMRA